MLEPDAHRAARRSAIAKLRSVLHYNGLPIDARSHHRRHLAGTGRTKARPRSDALVSAERSPRSEESLTTTDDTGTGKKTNRIGLEVAAVSRRQDDAVRGVRAQRDLRAHHRRVLRDGRRPEAR